MWFLKLCARPRRRACEFIVWADAHFSLLSLIFCGVLQTSTVVTIVCRCSWCSTMSTMLSYYGQRWCNTLYHVLRWSTMFYNLKSCLRCCLMFCNCLHVFEICLCHCLQHVFLRCPCLSNVFYHGLIFFQKGLLVFYNFCACRLKALCVQGAMLLNANFWVWHTSPEGAWLLEVNFLLVVYIAWRCWVSQNKCSPGKPLTFLTQ